MSHTALELVRNPAPLTIRRPYEEGYTQAFSIAGLNEYGEGTTVQQTFSQPGKGTPAVSVTLTEGYFTMTEEHVTRLGRGNVYEHRIILTTPEYGVEVLFAGIFQFT